MKISVIIPCRNEKDHALAFIEHLKQQVGFDNFQIIIADGKSNDGTKEVLEHSSKKYRNITTATDVLTFTLTQKIDNREYKRISDIFLSSEYIEMQSRKLEINTAIIVKIITI